MKRIFMLTLAVMCAGLMLVAFSACGDEEPTIVGQWGYEGGDDMYYTFNEDGTGSYFFLAGELKFTYEDDGKAVTLQYENSAEPNVFNYTIEGDTLKIEDSFGSVMTYIKK